MADAARRSRRRSGGAVRHGLAECPCRTGERVNLILDEARRWHTQDAEADLLGASIASYQEARVVEAFVDTETIYGGRCRRGVEVALALPEHVEADLSAYDDGTVFGPRINVGEQLIFGETLRRVATVGGAIDESAIQLANLVAALPCNPSAKCVGRMADEVSLAAKRRRALRLLREIELQVLDDPSVADAVLSLTDAWSVATGP